MQVRAFRASTISQALDLVRKELGQDAIILGNKKVAVSGSESVVEVTAAVEVEPSAAPAPPNPDKMIQGEIQEIKSLLSMLISSKDYFAQLQLEEPIAEIYHGLLSRGLDEKHTFLFLKKALQQLDKDSANKQQIVEAFCRQVLEKVKVARPFSNNSQFNASGRTFTFVGPTGVGKTTTLAKLAAYLKIKRQFEIGVISIDTYRIGAVDQLQTYTKILGIPMIVAQGSKELKNARRRFRNLDVILVDTIGKNFLRRNHIQDLQDAFADCEDVHHFLVVSATAKDADLKQTIHHFRSMKIHSLIFTKVDETLSHGCMINQLVRFPHAVSYLGTGQRVPEDIETASQKRLLSYLFPQANG
ncbi:MAG: AAA family ATPase [Syntrophobacteraceae bacterium]